MQNSQSKTYKIQYTLRRLFHWFTATRRRKILSSILSALILLTSIRFAFFNKPKQVLAAKMEVTETDGALTIDVPRRYRAVLQKGDTDDYLLLYDRAENNVAPKAVMEFESPRIQDEGVDHYLKYDGSRITTLLESTSTRIRIRVEGCFDTTAGGACIKDVDGFNNETLQVTTEHTFTPNGFFSNVEIDFKSGWELDFTDFSDKLREFVLYYNQNDWGTDTFSGTVYYGDGNTESNTSITSNISSNPDHYVVLEATGNFQDAEVGTVVTNGDRHLSNSESGSIEYTNDANWDLLRFQEGGQTYTGKGNAQFFFLFKDQSELDSEEEREGLFNDLNNPDTLSFTTGDVWDDKPISSGGTATSSAVLFHTGYEGGEADLCDGGDGWSNGVCDGSSTAAGNYTTEVFDGTYSARFSNQSAANNDAHAYYDGPDHQTLHTRLYFYVDSETLTDTDSFDVMIFRDSTNSQNNETKIKKVGSNLELRFADTASGYDLGSDSRIQTQTWYSLETRVYRHPSLGTANVWLDGKEVYAGTGLNTGFGKTERMRIGIISGDTATNVVLLDDVVISESYIGPGKFNEGQGAYAVDATESYSDFDIDAGGNVSDALAGAEDSGSTSIILSSSDSFPTAGVAYVEGDKFTYTGNDTGTETLSGIPSSGEDAINYHASGAVVSAPKRHSPSVKMRGYKNNTLPNEAVLEGERLQRDYDYIADIKPFSASYFADELYMHYSLEDINVDIGGANLSCDGSAIAGKYGGAYKFNSDGEDCGVAILEGTDYEQEQGTVEFWYQPHYDHTDAAGHYLFSLRANSSNEIYVNKQSDDDLEFQIDDDSVQHTLEVDKLDYSWNAYDWVHIKVTWDASEPVATQQRIFINGEEPTHTDDPESDDYDGVIASPPTTLTIGNLTSSFTSEANGIIDEFKLYNTSDAISTLASGGNTASSDEKLASRDRDASLAFASDGSNGRSEYMWLGSDSSFSGVNVDLETNGVGSSEDFDWEYWSATAGAWIVLQLTEQETGASEWTADGNFYFTPPADWLPYSVYGSTDLYYIRGHLESGSYSTTPVENKILTDIVTFQYTRYGGTISSENQTFEIPGWASGAPPVAYWKFDEGVDNTCKGGTNDVCDSSENGNDGAFAASTADPNWETEEMCVNGNCVFFDDDDEITISDDNSLDFGSGSFTVTAWTKKFGTGTDYIIAKMNDGDGEGDGGFFLRYSDDGDIAFATSDDDTQTDDLATSTFNDNRYTDRKWHHVTGVRDGSNSIKIYVDGILVGQDLNLGTGSVTNNDPIYIGQRGDDSAYFEGFIDQVKIYRYARSEEEIKSDYLQLASVKGSSATFGDENAWLSEGLVGYWKMDESSLNSCSGGYDACDSSGVNGNLDYDAGMDATDQQSGKYGNAVNFDGTSDLMRDTFAGSELIITEDLTLSAWIYRDAGGTDDGIIEMDGDGSVSGGETNYDFYINDSGEKLTIRWHYWDGAMNTVSIKSTIGLSNVSGSWVHVAVTRDMATNQLTFYENGKILGDPVSFSNDPTGGETTPNLEIGQGVSGNEFDGRIDEARVYNRTFTPAEVQKLYNWAPGPILYLPLDENTGTTVYDRSTTGESTNLEGSMTEEDWVPGKFGSALELDGIDDNFSISNSTLFDFETDIAFTFAGWFKITAHGADQDLFDGGATVTGDFRVTYDDGNSRIQAKIGGAVTDCRIDGSIDIADGLWHHIETVFYRNASCTTSDILIYVDGVQESTSVGISTNDSDEAIDVGDFDVSGSTAAINGVVDDIRVYNYARTQEQVVSDMNAGHLAPGSPVGSAIGHWKFDEGYGDTAYDTGTGGNNGDLGFSGQTCPASGAVPCPSWSNAGKIGKALEFDGTDDDIDGGDQDDLDMGTGDFAISAWVNLDSDVSNTIPTIYEKGGGSATQAGYWFYYDTSDDTIHLTLGDTTDEGGGNARATLETPLNGAVLDDDTWHHVVVVIDREPSTNDGYFYIDGLLVGGEQDNNDAGDSIDTTSDFEIGSKDDNANAYWDGHIDEVKVYKFTLTAEQVKTEYNFGKTAVFGSTSTDASGNATWSAANEYCPPGQESSCTAPVAEWLFDEKNGSSAQDTSGNGSVLTNVSTIWQHAGDCKYGACLEFDGTSSYTRTDDADSSVNIIGDLTLSAWVYRNSEGTDHTIIRQTGDGGSPGGNQNYRLQISSAELLEMEWEYGATPDSEDIVSTVALSNTSGSWVHLAITRNVTSDEVTFYENGVQLGDVVSLTNDPTGGDSSPDINIGADNSTPANPFDGKIDHVRVYNYARTPAQIAWEYNRGKPIHWYKFDECSGTTINDSGSGGVNGILTIGATDNEYLTPGTCSSGQLTEAWNAGTNGKYNGSIALDSDDGEDSTYVDDYITLSDNSSFPTRDFTVSAWFYAYEVNNDFIIHAPNDSGSENEFTMRMFVSAGTPYLRSCTDDATCFNSTDPFSINTWHHGVVTRNGSDITMYLDGVKNGTASDGDTLSFGTCTEFFIGMDVDTNCGATPASDGNQGWKGQLDDIRIHNYALTQQQIDDIYNQGAVHFGD